MPTIQLKKTCSLIRFNYHLDHAMAKRRASLRNAVAEYGSSYVIKKLVVLRMYRESMDTNAKKTQYNKLDSDIRYVQRYRNSMSPDARLADLDKTRRYGKLPPSKKSFC
jgi:hypothetical protein